MHLLVNESIRTFQIEERRNAERARLIRALRARRKAEVAARRAERAERALADAELALRVAPA